MYNLSAADAFLATGELQLPQRMKFPSAAVKRRDSPRDLSNFVRDLSLQDGDIDFDPQIYGANFKRSYVGGHDYHINSLAPHSDGQTFFSSDDLCINCWNMERPATCFSKFTIVVYIDVSAVCFSRSSLTFWLFIV